MLSLSWTAPEEAARLLRPAHSPLALASQSALNRRNPVHIQTRMISDKGLNPCPCAVQTVLTCAHTQGQNGRESLESSQTQHFDPHTAGSCAAPEVLRHLTGSTPAPHRGFVSRSGHFSIISVRKYQINILYIRRCERF